MADDIDLGGITIRAVIDAAAFVMPRAAVFPGSEASAFAAARVHDPACYDPAGDTARLSMKVFVLHCAGRVVLVDAGIGDGKDRPARPDWHRRETDFLARLGIEPEAVDMVVLTHLHADHVGWLTRAAGDGWVPTFPRARHVTGTAELAYWAGRQGGWTPPDPAPNHGAYLDSVAPLIAAGLMATVAPGTVLLPGVTTRALPGHTPGQMGLMLEGTAARALLCADAMHHAAQVIDPAIVSAFCIDPARAVTTRRAMLAEAARDGLLLVPGHPVGCLGFGIAATDGGFAIAATHG